MCEAKAVVVLISIILQVVASFCKYQAHTEYKLEHHSKIKVQDPCGNEFKNYCLNGGEWFYLVDEHIVGCNFTRLCGGKRCEKYMLWD